MLRFFGFHRGGQGAGRFSFPDEEALRNCRFRNWIVVSRRSSQSEHPGARWRSGLGCCPGSGRARGSWAEAVVNCGPDPERGGLERIKVYGLRVASGNRVVGFLGSGAGDLEGGAPGAGSLLLLVGGAGAGGWLSASGRGWGGVLRDLFISGVNEIKRGNRPL